MQNTLDKNTQKGVMALLLWDENKYAQYVYDCGIAYLNKYLPDYPQVVRQIIQSKVYWSWWKIHWQKRDLEFMEQCYNWDEGVEARIEVYEQLQDPRTLAAAIYLNGQVLQESYAAMIQQLTKEQREVAA